MMTSGYFSVILKPRLTGSFPLIAIDMETS
ncbi:hypothetical protein LINPERHAP2_LOCUS35549 [Linum perenne]